MGFCCLDFPILSVVFILFLGCVWFHVYVNNIPVPMRFLFLCKTSKINIKAIRTFQLQLKFDCYALTTKNQIQAPCTQALEQPFFWYFRVMYNPAHTDTHSKHVNKSSTYKAMHRVILLFLLSGYAVDIYHGGFLWHSYS